MIEHSSRFCRQCRALGAALAALLMATVAPISAAADTQGPAGRQLSWVLSQVNAARTPSQAEIAAHFSNAFLQALPPSAVVSAIRSISAQRPVRIASVVGTATPLQLEARLKTAKGPDVRVSIAVSAQPTNQIESLFFKPFIERLPISTWSSADRALGRLGSHAGLFAAHVNGGRLGRVIHARNADAPAAIASAFKLYVLGALAQAVSDKRAAWDEQLAIRDGWKSLPSGGMQNDAAGSHFTLRYYAEQMISVSDNTAADHLIRRLGRVAVEREFVALGDHFAARDRPLLTTREAFALKLAAPPRLLTAFSNAGARTRRDLLAQVDALPLNPAALPKWIAPRSVGSVEWFASPSDLGRAMIALEALARMPGLSPVGPILELNPGIQLDPSTWTNVAFKGGSEPGVISVTWYLVRADGKAFVVSMVVNDPKHPLDENAAIGVATRVIALLGHA
jgi:beta-lactamase class A